MIKYLIVTPKLKVKGTTPHMQSLKYRNNCETQKSYVKILLAILALLLVQADGRNICSLGTYLDKVTQTCIACHSQCSNSWCLDSTLNGCLQCSTDPSKQFRVLETIAFGSNALQINSNGATSSPLSWSCVESCPSNTLPTILRGRADFIITDAQIPQFQAINGTFKFCRSKNTQIQ
ncbi:hypothetical protein FGO68_gene10816 [Halteria grandinella]|uniref:Uncharacterized protein n=1 Tax=Halteria grandinella TaxID=5974 RepID=A0A8J8NHY1_HALGN|nr:hypothetical protein FGO68_gene10816 [Halteria grandinella]